MNTGHSDRYTGFTCVLCPRDRRSRKKSWPLVKGKENSTKLVISWLQREKRFDYRNQKAWSGDPE